MRVLCSVSVISVVLSLLVGIQGRETTGIKKIKSETFGIYKSAEHNQSCYVRMFRLYTTQHGGIVYTDCNVNGDLWICSVYNLNSHGGGPEDNLGLMAFIQ